MAKVYDCKYENVWTIKKCPYAVGEVVHLTIDKDYNPDRVFIVLDFTYDETALDWEFKPIW